jgi:hypothetical protein
MAIGRIARFVKDLACLARCADAFGETCDTKLIVSPDERRLAVPIAAFVD